MGAEVYLQAIRANPDAPLPTFGLRVIKLSMPQAFLDQNAVGNRLIWEMQSNWNPADQLQIRRIVLKGFRAVP